MTRLGNYVLDGRMPRLEPDPLKWAMWFETAERTVRRSVLKRGDPPEEYAVVSTVFLGLDHNWSRMGPPVLFETMVFLDGEALDLQERCCTWADAERQHVSVCRQVEERFAQTPLARSWRRGGEEQRDRN